jgi:hypothetical protein
MISESWIYYQEKYTGGEILETFAFAFADLKLLTTIQKIGR